MIAGAILLVLGVVFLMNSSGIARIHFPSWNWPALLLLLPVFWAARSAYQAYQANGEQVNREVRDKALWVGLFVLLFGMTFYGWRWGQVWPLILIAIGVSILLSRWNSPSV